MTIGIHANISVGMDANHHIRNILFLADRYRSHVNLALSTVSLRAAGKGSYLPELQQRLANGEANAGTRRLWQIMTWFDGNWPSDLEWPEDIPRPSEAAQEVARHG